MADTPSIERLAIENTVLRNVVTMMIAQLAEQSSDPPKWIRDLKTRLIALEAQARGMATSTEAQKYADAVLRETENLLGSLR